MVDNLYIKQEEPGFWEVRANICGHTFILEETYDTKEEAESILLQICEAENKRNG